MVTTTATKMVLIDASGLDHDYGVTEGNEYFEAPHGSSRELVYFTDDVGSVWLTVASRFADATKYRAVGSIPLSHLSTVTHPKHVMSSGPEYSGDSRALLEDVPVAKPLFYVRSVTDPKNIVTRGILTPGKEYAVLSESEHSFLIVSDGGQRVWSSREHFLKVSPPTELPTLRFETFEFLSGSPTRVGVKIGEGLGILSAKAIASRKQQELLGSAPVLLWETQSNGEQVARAPLPTHPDHYYSVRQVLKVGSDSKKELTLQKRKKEAEW